MFDAEAEIAIEPGAAWSAPAALGPDDARASADGTDLALSLIHI